MFCLLFLVVAAINNASAQRIIGTVHDKNNQPLEGASVGLKGTSIGTTTDSAGAFRLEGAVSGELVISYIGYKTKTLPVQPGMTVKVVLDKDPSTLGPVTISAGSFEANDKSKGAVMTAMDVVSVAGNGGDVANAIRTLPGAQQVGEREGLFVRGGTGEETRQFVDGTMVPRPYFVTLPGIPQFNRISSPFMFEGVVFSSGGYSALYGQGLSGALIMETVDLPEKSSAILGISPIVAVAGIQKLAANKRSSVSLNTRYMNYNAYSKVIPQKPDYFSGPAYWMTESMIRAKTGKTGMFKLYANFGYNKTGLYRDDVDSAALRQGFEAKDRNLYVNMSHRSRPWKGWQLDVAAAFNHNETDIRNSLVNAEKTIVQLPDTPYNAKNGTFLTGGNYYQGRIVLSRYLAGDHVLKAGAEYELNDDRYYQDQHYAAFAEAEWRIAWRLALRTGLRFEYSPAAADAEAAPRLSLAYRLGDGSQLNAAWGIFYQKADPRYLRLDPYLSPARATHYVVNYLRRSHGRLFRGEVFYKKYDRLLKTVPHLDMSGNGDAKGFELFWRDKKPIRNLDYWASYSFLSTQRNHLDFPRLMEPSFAAPHTFSLVVKRYFEPIHTNINLSYSLAAGRPYYDIAGGTIRDQGITRPYNVLNLGISYLTALFPKWKQKDFTVIAFGVNNVLGTRQVFGYQYSYNGMNKVPVMLPATRSFFIGIFMSLGIDRTEDYLNENL